MIRSRTRWAVVAACCLAAAALLSAADKDGKFSLAVLRRDGLMIPFAAFNGRAWSVPWPGSANVPLPISLSDIPKTCWGEISPSAPWTAWLPGNERRTLKLEKPVHVPIFCGAFTPTEIIQVWEAGADAAKIFPAEFFGPGYIKSLKGPLPHIEMVPTGGVNENNVGEFLKAGAYATAAGSSLVDGKAFKEKNWAAITAKAKAFVSAVAAAVK